MILDLVGYWLVGVVVLMGISASERRNSKVKDLAIAVIFGWIFWPFLLLSLLIHDEDNE